MPQAGHMSAPSSLASHLGQLIHFRVSPDQSIPHCQNPPDCTPVFRNVKTESIVAERVTVSTEGGGGGHLLHRGGVGPLDEDAALVGHKPLNKVRLLVFYRKENRAAWATARPNRCPSVQLRARVLQQAREPAELPARTMSAGYLSILTIFPLTCTYVFDGAFFLSLSTQISQALVSAVAISSVP